MKKETRIILFVVVVSIIAIALVIFRYEKLLIDKEREHKEITKIPGGVAIKTEYTAQEIIELTKKSPEYLGDSVTIFENGDMVSSNGKFNGTIQAVISNDGNMGIVKSNMQSNKLPLQYNIYRLAGSYYRQQYPEEVKNLPANKNDSTQLK
jgi:uncharacterized protein (UPF0333 family)